MSKTSMATVKPPSGTRVRADKKLASSLGFVQFGHFLVWGSVPSVLLAVQMEDLDPGNKEANLALVVGLGALVATVIQPVWGMASDRTRSRYGKRTPWLLGGAILAVLGLLAIALGNTVVTIAVSWCVVQAAVNGANGILTAVMPDRVPESVRGVFSAVLGLGTMAGILGGQMVASALVPHRQLLPYAVVAAVVVTTTVVFVLLNPEEPSLVDERQPLAFSSMLGLVWVNPRKYPDFAFTFLSRLFLMLGYHMVGAYQLYILQDHIGFDRAEALRTLPKVIMIAAAVMLVSLLLSGWLSDRTGRRKPFLVASSLIIALGLMMPFLVPSATGFVLYGAVVGFGFGAYQALDAALISMVLPSQEDTAKDLGVANLAAHLPPILGPAAAGLVVLHAGGYPMLFVLAGAAAFLGALFLLPIKSVR
ncbi:MFS transporter [Nocardioides sp. KC13]|uniref:MFS transporter n=1 Tax=Nocardioides turkmenicus TaxID=2711220 RepID=A0A6M1QVQ6_9ACTN|nr:MFS transporter [Nocardioides sp. KC13]NGN94015.1 MFS transporter [Nocardioides sp. KC13]